MKRLISINLLMWTACLSVSAQTRFTDFESSVPSYLSKTGSTALTTSYDHVKDGSKALIKN